MDTIFYIGLFLGFGYLIILILLGWRWTVVEEFLLPADYQPITPISVLVSAKNEVHNLPIITRYLQKVNYPSKLVEFIIINDHSTDLTISTWDSLGLPSNFSIINSKGKPGKKSALTQGIAFAKNNLIVTTDMDCRPNPNWLKSISYLMEKEKPQFIAGPVQFSNEQSIFERFQSLDFLGMMLITGVGIDSGSFYMANGANMAFQKSAFISVGGYEGNEHIASGDDMFLVHKIANHFPKGAIQFNKSLEAMVSTSAETTLLGFIHQRVRWGGKNKASKDFLLKLILGWVLLTSIWIVIFPFVKYWIVILVLKLLGDFILLRRATSFFGRKTLMLSFIPSFFMHTIYIAGIGILSFFWKGRWK